MTRGRVTEDATKNRPGGSIGDPAMSFVLAIESLDSLIDIFEHDFGYDSIHNNFFRSYTKGQLVADLGCGHGYSSLYLSTEAERVVGFDVDREAIEQASSLSTRLKSTNVEFHTYSGYETRFPSDYFGVIVSADVIEHVPEPLRYLKEAFRICSPNGRLLVSTPNGLMANGDMSIILSHSIFHVMEFNPAQLKTMINDAGFKLDLVLRQVRRKSNVGFVARFVSMLMVIRDRVFGTVIARRIHGIPFLFDLKRRLGMTEDMGNFRIVKTTINDITSKNCDAIVLVAHKD